MAKTENQGFVGPTREDITGTSDLIYNAGYREGDVPTIVDTENGESVTWEFLPQSVPAIKRKGIWHLLFDLQTQRYIWGDYLPTEWHIPVTRKFLGFLKNISLKTLTYKIDSPTNQILVVAKAAPNFQEVSYSMEIPNIIEAIKVDYNPTPEVTLNTYIDKTQIHIRVRNIEIFSLQVAVKDKHSHIRYNSNFNEKTFNGKENLYLEYEMLNLPVGEFTVVVNCNSEEHSCSLSDTFTITEEIIAAQNMKAISEAAGTAMKDIRNAMERLGEAAAPKKEKKVVTVPLPYPNLAKREDITVWVTNRESKEGGDVRPTKRQRTGFFLHALVSPITETLSGIYKLITKQIDSGLALDDSFTLRSSKDQHFKLSIEREHGVITVRAQETFYTLRFNATKYFEIYTVGTNLVIEGTPYKEFKHYPGTIMMVFPGFNYTEYKDHTLFCGLSHREQIDIHVPFFEGLEYTFFIKSVRAWSFDNDDTVFQESITKCEYPYTLIHRDKDKNFKLLQVRSGIQLTKERGFYTVDLRDLVNTGSEGNKRHVRVTDTGDLRLAKLNLKPNAVDENTVLNVHADYSTRVGNHGLVKRINRKLSKERLERNPYIVARSYYLWHLYDISEADAEFLSKQAISQITEAVRHGRAWGWENPYCLDYRAYKGHSYPNACLVEGRVFGIIDGELPPYIEVLEEAEELPPVYKYLINQQTIFKVSK